ncbi:hypothetical protein BCEP27_130088 [Burkholderia cepacia]
MPKKTCRQVEMPAPGDGQCAQACPNKRGFSTPYFYEFLFCLSKQYVIDSAFYTEFDIANAIGNQGFGSST